MGNPRPMTVLIDNRAGSKDLIRYPPLSECGELCRLESADACFAGNGPVGSVVVGVEVKSIWDVLSSAGTGRLQATQIPAMLTSYDVGWMVYYGIYRPSPRDGTLEVRRGKLWKTHRIGSRAVPYGYLESLLLDLVVLGINVKLVADMREVATWIGVLYRWWSKPWDKHRGMRTFDNSGAVSLMPGMNEGTHLRARVAAQLPGVGFERAVRAAQHFTSVREMIGAGREEWAKVPGIGKVIAKAVEESLK